MVKAQRKLLNFLENENDLVNDFEKLKKFMKKQIIKEKGQGFKEFLYLISKISNNHQRTHNFLEKIESILLFLKDKIKKNFTNTSIFNIFQNNKRILLFLITNGIITIDKYILQSIEVKNNYTDYLAPEILSLYYKQNLGQTNMFSNSFEENRKTGENHNYICELIRNDSIEEFIVYVNKTDLNLKSKISPSIFETNPFLLKYKDTRLIEYTAFFGSIKIFNYILNQKIKMNDRIYLYAIHSNNAEIISIIEDNNIMPKSVKKCFNEAIKCYHNDIANYIQDKYMEDQMKYDSKILKYFNFLYMPKNFLDKSNLKGLIKYDYVTLVKILYKSNKIDINELYVIQN